MIDRIWKHFYWTSAVLIGALTTVDAYIWIGADAGAQLVSAGICGFVAVLIWLLTASSIYELASRP